MINLENYLKTRPRSLRTNTLPAALDRWDPDLRAADGADEDNVIAIMDILGEDWWTGTGFTAKRARGALRAIGDKNPVTVLINSPGGDVFEGIAIYNLLAQHQGEVTVRVLGMAASAASVIAMAGDRIEISKAAFFMVHNVWTIAAGDRNFFAEVAEWLEPFDNSIRDVYVDRTGLDAGGVAAMLDKETWVNATDAVAKGFADEVVDNKTATAKETEAEAQNIALRKLEAALCSGPMSRKTARDLLKGYTGSKPGAADPFDKLGAVDLDRIESAANRIKGNLI